MRPEARILGGLAFITAGGAGLIAMNLWTVPTIAQGRPRSEPTTVTSSEVKPPEATATATPLPTRVASASAAPAASGVAPVGSAGPGTEQPAGDGGTTSRSEDGTTFEPIVFEPQSKVLTKDLIKKIAPIAAYTRNNYAMMVMLTGHGDAGMQAAEYIRMGRARAGAVLRVFVDYGVSGARIGIVPPEVEGDKVVTGGIRPGTVEIRIKPRFSKSKKGGANGP